MLNISLFKRDSKNDWPEDFHLENGNYYCRCVSCNIQFVGYKRRIYCKVCHNAEKRKYKIWQLYGGLNKLIMKFMQYLRHLKK